MNLPMADPIPLPAPVWLMKLLSLVTLALHFSAVMILVGSLLLIIGLNVRGRSSRSADLVSASFTLAKRLPVVMTYVINLGVPPLLFLQVLYGRHIYSSSVLMAVPWISIIVLVMLDYWLIYRIVGAIEKGRTAWFLGIAALLVTMGIGQIYAMNMTLMLRPEVWRDMYLANPTGMQAPHGDPSTTPRWLFVMAGGPLFGGLWAALLSNMVYLKEGVRTTLRKSGGVLASVGAVLQVFFAIRIMSVQPDHVREGISGSPLYNFSALAFLVTVALAGAVGLVQGIGKGSTLLGTVGILTAFLATATAGIVRDGIRDFTLLKQGFNVYDVTVYANWSVLIAFLLLFVIMLGVIFWLFQVMRQATPPNEEVPV